MGFRRLRFISLKWFAFTFVFLIRIHCALASASAPLQVVDVENLRLVTVSKGPNDSPTCDVLVVGGGLGGVAAAEDLARLGVSVILAEATSHLGGQLTDEGVSVPDENRYIEDEYGPGTRHYRALREKVRSYYSRQPGILADRWTNVGDCWNSVISGEPAVWEEAIKERLEPLEGPRGIRRILIREEVVDVQRYPGNGKISYVDLVNLDTGRLIRIGAQFVLDATETGDVLALAGSPWTIGQEPRAEYGEPDAPLVAEPNWIQSFTYCFDLRLTDGAEQQIPLKPASYDEFAREGEYSLVYQYPQPRGDVLYKMFETVNKREYGSFWAYRRVLASSSFKDVANEPQDVSLINWRGNDYRDISFIGQPPSQELSILTTAREFSKGFLYWIRTACPRDDGGFGYPELVPANGELGADGMALSPYIRESRRLRAVTMLTENDMIASSDSSQTTTGTEFFDTVGIASYPIDVHPAAGEPPHLIETLPYEIPLGAFVAKSGPVNILPASFDFGGSRLAMASARVHPTEWLAGEIAAHIAAFCIRHEIEPADIRQNSQFLTMFQNELVIDGINIDWHRELGIVRR